MALAAEVPLELVQKVTGHKTTEIVLKHDYQPGLEEFRRALQSAMPELLTKGHALPEKSAVPGTADARLAQIAAIVANSSSRTAWRDIQRVRELTGKPLGETGP